MRKHYQLELAPAAKRDLKRWPLVIQPEIVNTHLPAIQSNPWSLSEPLSGTLKGERSYHLGRKPEYRLIFYLEDNLITVTIIGTRKGIYKRAKRKQK
jgi:mRNA-degrading endonuclease RelE of RelBE toxin-antitoxin system